MARQQRGVEKERHWAKVIREAARSGKSIREFCTQRKLKESQFYRWQRKLRERREDRVLGRNNRPTARGEAARFALVSDEPGQLDAGIELVLADGRRARIGHPHLTLRAPSFYPTIWIPCCRNQANDN